MGYGVTAVAPSEELLGMPATELGYFKDMFTLQAPATFMGLVMEGDRWAVISDRTILYPQGGGQPCDTGFISALDEKVKFRVDDVRAKNGLVYHYGNFESSKENVFQEGEEVLLTVDSSRRKLNSRASAHYTHLTKHQLRSKGFHVAVVKLHTQDPQGCLAGCTLLVIYWMRV